MKKLPRDKYLTEPELRQLLAAAKARIRAWDGGARFAPDGSVRRRGTPHPNAARDYALLATAALTGLRGVELVGLRVGDLRGVIGPTRDERPARTKVLRAKRRDAAGLKGIPDEIVIPASARLALQDYLKPLPVEQKRPWSRVFPISVKRAQEVFKFYAARAGLNPAYSLHALRHTRGTMLYEQHRDLKLVQSALGHARLETTAIYMHTVDLERKLEETDLQDPTPDQPEG